jgi:hypothetical protein
LKSETNSKSYQFEVYYLGYPGTQVPRYSAGPKKGFLISLFQKQVFEFRVPWYTSIQVFDPAVKRGFPLFQKQVFELR